MNRRRLAPCKPLLLSAALLIGPFLEAGVIRHDIDRQVYADFGSNLGRFSPGNAVSIYDINGNRTGTLDIMPNFDSLPSGLSSIISGSSQSVIGIAHSNVTTEIEFSRFDSNYNNNNALTDRYYQILVASTEWNVATDSEGNIRRLDKIITEAEPTPFMTSDVKRRNLRDTVLVRSGDGAASRAVNGANTNEPIAKGFLGGTLRYTRAIETGKSEQGLATYEYSTTFSQVEARNSPLGINMDIGDSGSPTLAWNSDNNRYEVVAAHRSGSTSRNGGATGYGKSSFQGAVPSFYTNQLNHWNSPQITPSGLGDEITWGTPDGNGAGTIRQNGISWNYVGLREGLHGTTSTQSANLSNTDAFDTSAARVTANINAPGYVAILIINTDPANHNNPEIAPPSDTNSPISRTRNLIFADSGRNFNIVLDGSLDMGAGSLTFNGDYTITNGGVASRRLNSAGFIVNADATVTTVLTGIAGDDWRKIGEGKLIVSGVGANLAKLTIGGAGIVELDRVGGAAAASARISGGAATLRLMRTNQVSGEISFGLRGGTLDLYGTNFSDAQITHLDRGAKIANRKADTTSTFTFTGNGAQEFRGGFFDGGSQAGGALAIDYNPDVAAGAVWKLSGETRTAGAVSVTRGDLKIEGSNTLHAENYVDADDWSYAEVTTGRITVADSAKLTLSHHARLDADVTVNAGGTFAVTENLFKSNGESVDGSYRGLPGSGTPSPMLYGHQSGSVNLEAANSAMTATISALSDHSAVYSRNITGLGTFTKNGPGILTLNGANTYTGTSAIAAGSLVTGSGKALGDSAAITVAAGATLQIGNGTANTVTLAAGATLAVEGTLKFFAANSRITLAGTGGYELKAGTYLDLNNAFNTVGSYTLITGGTGAKTDGAFSLTGYNLSAVSVNFAQGTLTVTAVPEPAAYGLLGAASLLGAALVRRRRKAARLA